MQDLKLPSTAVGDVIKARRTVHDFTLEVPSRELLLKAIEHARWAPNHHRTEPWKFYLISKRTGTEIAQLNAELVRAKSGDEAAAKKLRRWQQMPGWMALTCKKSEEPAREQEDYAACCCAAQNLSLYLWELGIGMKWGTGKVIRDSRFFELIGAMPAREFVVGLFWYGYPAEIPAQARGPLEDVVCDVI